MKIRIKLSAILLTFLIPGILTTQTGDLKLLDWRPTSQLVVQETKVLKPKYPVIDIHNHLGDLENAEKYLEEMDKAGVWKCVSLDGFNSRMTWRFCHLTMDDMFDHSLAIYTLSIKSIFTKGINF